MNDKSYEVIDPEGVIRYYDVAGKLHRMDGPAITYPNGTEYWYFHGKRHREDGPAVWISDNEYGWFHMGEYHRDDGPAMVFYDGTMVWCRNGKKHNAHGPALIYKVGDGKIQKEWWFEGIQYKDEANMLSQTVPSIEKLSEMFKEVQCERQLG